MSAPIDTLTARLARLLAETPGGISEHRLIQRLRREGCPEVPEINRRDLYGLFRTHFRLFHALYALRDQLRRERRAELVPDPMAIRLDAWRPGTDALDHPDELAAFYADLSRLDDMGPDEVARMVTGLRRRRQLAGQRAAALAVLGLEEPAPASRIKQRYRELAMRWHPDRGGDGRRFQELQEAYAILTEI